MAYAYPATANPVSIIGPHFCVPHPVELAVIRNVKTITHGDFVVTDNNGYILFKVKDQSVEDQIRNNTKEDVCDFKVKGSWSKKSCVIYVGETSTIVAQMHEKHTVQNVLGGKDEFMVTVNPNIDYAFIVALIVALDGIHAAAMQAGQTSAGASAAAVV
ncbi:hypothetical protein COLO4_06872 [Corchorus olitorius]|uniref:Initiation factor 2B-related protein n=1 Tax=Corchorus olitorius TaxID=93759 RepID=A0A1R3KLM9_9ROSI|nr:hypothetical protein COLO4_06872 [Corchorus olitorius]